jgi:hypothetical protein
MKKTALKLHKIIGSLLLLPLMWTAGTGMAFTYVKEFLHNKALAKTIINLHMFGAFGLQKFYPFILGISLIVTLFSAMVLMWRSPRKKVSEKHFRANY